MSNPIRFAVVGLDHWYSAIDFAERCVATDGAELVGIADANEDHAREVAEKCGGVPYTTDLMASIHDENVDAIAAYASVDQNPAICIAAAKAGKHIVSVKPLANTLDEAIRIVRAVRDAGVVFIPSESRFRVTPVTAAMKEAVTSGQLGEVTSGEFLQTGGWLPTSWPTSGVSADGGWWIEADKAPGGGWIDHAIYQIDRLRYVLGQEVVRVTGRTANLIHKEIPFEDWGHAVIEFERGAMFAIEDTWSGPQGGWRSISNIAGTEGIYDADSLRGTTRLFKTGEGWSDLDTTDLNDDLGVIEPIIAAIRGEQPAFATVDDAWINLAVCLAFYEAARTGTTVTVPSLAEALA